MRWFRFYDEVLDDPKVRRLPAALAWCWVLILCAANRHHPRGVVPEVDDLAFILRVSRKKTIAIRERLRVVGLLDMDDDERVFFIHNWNVRQREYDVSTPRTRTFRERSANMPDTDTEEIQKQNRGEESKPQTVTFTETGFDIFPQLLERWNIAYPAVDVPVELRAIFEWTQANPANRKSNWQRFIVAWLKRAQDRAPTRAAVVPPPEKIRPAILDAPPPEFRPMPDELRQSIAHLARGMKMP